VPILFGWGKTTVKDHGECIAASCPRCHNQVILRHLLVTTWFTLFFIPLIPYKRRRALVCGICSWARDVPKEQVPLTDEMNTITAQWRAGGLDDGEYGKRVEAYWSFQSGGNQLAPALGSDSSSSEPDQPLHPDRESHPGTDN
jgi:hypothetical protein